MGLHTTEVINLQFICALMEITQRQIAERMGVPQTTVFKLMQDRPYYEADPEDLKRFMEAFTSLCAPETTYTFTTLPGTEILASITLHHPGKG